MESIKVYKARAIKSLSGNWGKGVIATILCNMATSIPIVNFLISYGFSAFFLDCANGKKVNIGQLFDGFKDFGRIFLTMLLIALRISLWAAVFIIPFFITIFLSPTPLAAVGVWIGLIIAIVKFYSYSMTAYIMRENPEMKYNQAINKSVEIMKDKKMDLFLIDLSMIGWGILSIVTFGLGYLFLNPYRETVYAHFYKDARQELEDFQKAWNELGLDNN